MKNFVLLYFTLVLSSCTFTSDINKYSVENKGLSNFTINHRELFPYEELFITINDKYFYNCGGKKINYWNISYYKLPENVVKINVKTNCKGKPILRKTIIDKELKRKELMISIPFPKEYKNKKFKFPPKYRKFSIEESERDISLIYY